MKLSIFCDGGARGNPGPAAVGIVIQDQKGKVTRQFGKKIGVATNNIAEYIGVIEALKYLAQYVTRYTLHVTRIDFYLDSKLVVNQLNGTFKLKNPNLRELLLKIRSLEQEIGGKIFYHFIPRERNLAHPLVKKCFFLKKFTLNR